MIQFLSRGLLLVVLVTAVLFGAINSRVVPVDFLFAEWSLPLGVALLAFMFLGAALGLCAAYLALVPGLNRQMRELKKQASVTRSS